MIRLAPKSWAFFLGMIGCLLLATVLPFWLAWLSLFVLATFAEIFWSYLRAFHFRGELVYWVVIGAVVPLYWFVLVR